MEFDVPAYLFVIDTNKYSGNFERELCAYMTGIIGACEVGSEEAEEFRHDVSGKNPFEAIIATPADEHGCCRPVTTWASPGWFNNGMGYEFRPGQEKKARNHYVRACLEEAKKTPYARPEANAKHAAEWQAKAKERLVKYPAHNSVAICFEKRPSKKLIALMYKRAKEFCRKQKITVSGFRLIALEVKKEEIDISVTTT